MASRYESDQAILELQKTYPAAFFETPQLRKPLKHEIIEDIIKDGFPIARSLLTAALDWYRGHYGYQYALKAGVKRIGLHGKECGTVTQREQLEAEKEIQRISDMRKLSHSNPANRFPTVETVVTKKPIAHIGRAPELVPIYEALEAANVIILGNSQSPTLRDAMRTAALTVVIEETRRVIDARGLLMQAAE